MTMLWIAQASAGRGGWSINSMVSVALPICGRLFPALFFFIFGMGFCFSGLLFRFFGKRA
jgi:hypothetical protein